MAKEITGYTNDIKSDINRKNFGFVFSSENAVLKDLNIQNIMVYKADVYKRQILHWQQTGKLNLHYTGLGSYILQGRRWQKM